MGNWYSKKVQRQGTGDRVVFSADDTGTTGHLPAKKWNFGSYFVPYTKITLKWIRDLHVKA